MDGTKAHADEFGQLGLQDAHLPAPYVPSAQRRPFDPLTIALHWMTLALFLALIAAAWLHANAYNGAQAQLMLNAHRTIGLIVWIMSAGRLCWRLTGAKLPHFPAAMSTPHRWLVKLSEYAFYALLLIQPLTGVAQTLLRGKPFDFLVFNIPAIMAHDAIGVHWFHELHERGAYAFMVLAGGHALTALTHHLILRDDVLVMMAPGLGKRGKTSDSGPTANDA